MNSTGPSGAGSDPTGGHPRPDQPPPPPVAVLLDREPVTMADDYESRLRRVEFGPDAMIGDVLIEMIRGLPSVAASVSWTIWARNHPRLRYSSDGAATSIVPAAGEQVRCAFVSAPYQAEKQIVHIGGFSASTMLRTSYLTPAATGEYVFQAVYHTSGLVGLSAYQEWVGGLRR